MIAQFTPDDNTLAQLKSAERLRYARRAIERKRAPARPEEPNSRNNAVRASARSALSLSADFTGLPKHVIVFLDKQLLKLATTAEGNRRNQGHKSANILARFHTHGLTQAAARRLYNAAMKQNGLDQVDVDTAWQSYYHGLRQVPFTVYQSGIGKALTYLYQLRDHDDPDLYEEYRRSSYLKVPQAMKDYSGFTAPELQRAALLIEAEDDLIPARAYELYLTLVRDVSFRRRDQAANFKALVNIYCLRMAHERKRQIICGDNSVAVWVGVRVSGDIAIDSMHTSSSIEEDGAPVESSSRAPMHRETMSKLLARLDEQPLITVVRGKPHVYGKATTIRVDWDHNRRPAVDIEACLAWYDTGTEAMQAVWDYEGEAHDRNEGYRDAARARVLMFGETAIALVDDQWRCVPTPKAIVTLCDSDIAMLKKYFDVQF